MSRRAYSEINLHLTWHVKESLPIINGSFEGGLHHHLRSYALKQREVIVHAVGGTETHVHMAVSIPPTLQIAEWIGRLKGSSSHHVNHKLVNRHLLDWQEGYGVVSFGTRALPWTVAYVENQKEHHANGKIHERLGEVQHRWLKPLLRLSTLKRAKLISARLEPAVKRPVQ